jgi:hypothetical protein
MSYATVPLDLLFGKNVMTTDEKPVWAQDYGWTCPKELRIPVIQPWKMQMIGSGIYTYEDMRQISYCVIIRPNNTMPTCHACEGGHHVHIYWND